MRILGDRIMIKPDPKSEVAQGIVKPNYILLNEKVPTGTVVLVGSGKKIPAEVQVGSRVRIDTAYASVDYPLNGEMHRIVSIKDVQMVLG